MDVAGPSRCFEDSNRSCGIRLVGGHRVCHRPGDGGTCRQVDHGSGGGEHLLQEGLVKNRPFDERGPDSVQITPEPK